MEELARYGINAKEFLSTPGPSFYNDKFHYTKENKEAIQRLLVKFPKLRKDTKRIEIMEAALGWKSSPLSMQNVINRELRRLKKQSGLCQMTKEEAKAIAYEELPSSEDDDEKALVTVPSKRLASEAFSSDLAPEDRSIVLANSTSSATVVNFDALDNPFFLVLDTNHSLVITYPKSKIVEFEVVVKEHEIELRYTFVMMDKKQYLHAMNFFGSELELTISRYNSFSSSSGRKVHVSVLHPPERMQFVVREKMDPIDYIFDTERGKEQSYFIVHVNYVPIPMPVEKVARITSSSASTETMHGNIPSLLPPPPPILQLSHASPSPGGGTEPNFLSGQQQQVPPEILQTWMAMMQQPHLLQQFLLRQQQEQRISSEYQASPVTDPCFMTEVKQELPQNNDSQTPSSTCSNEDEN